MNIALMSYIKDDAVAREVKHAVQGNGQLDRAEVGGEMTAGLFDMRDQKIAELAAQSGHLGEGERFDVCRAFYMV